MIESDTIIIGGGVVGLSIAYGLAKAGEQVQVLDEGDDSFRASRGNFGLIWVQGKGADNPDYARWSIESAKLWPAFAEILEYQSGINLQRTQEGGLMLALSEAELEARACMMQGVADSLAVSGQDYPFEILDANALSKLCRHVGPKVAGGCFSPLDGHVSPLRLLRALVSAIDALGGVLKTGHSVRAIEARGGTFQVHAGAATHLARKVVLAAGLGNAILAPMVGLHAPVTPLRGQVLITERVEPFLHLPTGSVRQTGDGGIQIGESHEHVGFDVATSLPELQRITTRATQMFPILEGVNVVRSWGALRVMTSDGYPIYQASVECPGAFLVTCHSGITLASQHAGAVAGWILGGAEPDHFSSFKAERFNV